MIFVRLYRCGLDIGLSELRERGLAVLEKIVVGYAGDQAGRDAVKLAARLAAVLSSHVTIVFPYHPLSASVPGDRAEEDVRGEVQALTAGIGGLAAPTYHWSPSPWPIHALHELAGYEDANLIVFGAAHEGLADHLHVSLMERMVHGAPCAVAVAPAGYAGRDPGEAGRVGVGFSDSDEGKAALHLAHELAGILGGELEVIAGSGLSPALASYAFSSPSLPAAEDEMYAETKANLERVAGELGDGVPVHLETVRGDPSEVLIERSGNLDILMLGSRAYGPLRHVLLGSVSACVMREAHCPVLVVPRGAPPRE
ncbi:MAG TPA: universal stress protein [Solirubrobacteraceae bacterium]|nr:universal stress protein [Solirubrobacteraceae bacterium]